MATPPRWRQVGDAAAEMYERRLVPAMFAMWAAKLVDLAEVGPGDHVLDLACGTGVVTRRAAVRAGSAGRVMGLDLNPSMLAVARSLPPVVGAPIEWVEANVAAMPLPDAAFDVALCQHGLQQFPDRPSALRELRRVLRADGRLELSVWSRIEANPGFLALVEALERRVGMEAANNRRAPFALADAAQVGGLLADAGFRDVQVATWVELARFSSPEEMVAAQLGATPLSTLGTLSDETQRAIARDVRAELRAFLSEDGLVVPMEAHIACARA